MSSKIKNCRNLSISRDGDYYCRSSHVCYKSRCNNDELFPIRLAWSNY